MQGHQRRGETSRVANQQIFPPLELRKGFAPSTMGERLRHFMVDYLTHNRESSPNSWPAYLLNHTLRVARFAKAISQREGADQDVVVAAALLHDIEKPSHEGVEHALMGAQKASKVLGTMGADPRLIARATNAIKTHFPAEEDRGSDYLQYPLENRVLYDADFIDANFGTMALARYVINYARKTPPDADPVEFIVTKFTDPKSKGDLSWIQRRNPEIRFMKTDTGREIVKDMLGYMGDFVEGLTQERQAGENAQTHGSLHSLIGYLSGLAKNPDLERDIQTARKMMAHEPGTRLHGFFTQLDKEKNL